ncbi:MAG: PEGA domain-containing protein [Candidatus Solibacter usitatus]|nr:PEGA domain-containing protein [Candidatus Solibacter usitatus]
MKQNLMWIGAAIVIGAGWYFYVSSGRTMTIEVGKQGSSIIVVTPGVPGAQVIVDDKPAGVTDAKGQLRLELPPKDYFVVVKKDGYGDAQSRIELGKNEEREVTFEMGPATQTPPPTPGKAINKTPVKLN